MPYHISHCGMVPVDLAACPPQHVLEQPVDTDYGLHLQADAVVLASLCDDLSVQAAEAILETIGGLGGLVHLDANELMHLLGKDLATIHHIQAAMELGRRVLAPRRLALQCSSPSMIARVMMPLIGNLPYEELWILLVDQQNRLIRRVLHTRGTINSAAHDPARIMQTVLSDQRCASFALCHNHPSGAVNPSPGDLQITRTIAHLGNDLHRPLLDHVIVGSGAWYGMRSIMLWETVSDDD